MTLESFFTEVARIANEHKASCPDVEYRYGKMNLPMDDYEASIAGSVMVYNAKKRDEYIKYKLEGDSWAYFLHVGKDTLKYNRGGILLEQLPATIKRVQEMSKQ